MQFLGIYAPKLFATLARVSQLRLRRRSHFQAVLYLLIKRKVSIKCANLSREPVSFGDSGLASSLAWLALLVLISLLAGCGQDPFG